ncbi:PAS domain S-box protein [Persephonella sp.]
MNSFYIILLSIGAFIFQKYLFPVKMSIDLSFFSEVIIYSLIVVGLIFTEKLKSEKKIYNPLFIGLSLLLIAQTEVISNYIYHQPDYVYFAGEIGLRLIGIIFLLSGFITGVKFKEETEKKLREQAERYLSVLEKGNDIIVIIQNGIIKYVNKKIKDILGYDPEEVIGMHYMNFIPSEYHQKLSSSDLTKKFEIELMTKNKNRIIVEVSASETEFDNKTSSIWIIRDITERKEKENLLKETMEMLAVSQKLARLGNWQWFLDSNKFWVSKEGCEIICGKSKEFNGYIRDFYNFVHPEDKPLLLTKRKEMLEKGKPYEFVYRIKPGEKRPELVLREITKLIKDENGNITRVIGIIQDVTNQTKTYQKIIENEEKYRNLFDNSNDAIIIHDLNGTIIDSNKKSVEIFGYNRIDLALINIQDLYLEDEILKYKWAVNKLLDDRFVKYETILRSKLGRTFPAEISSSLFEIRGKKYIQDIIRDITDRKRSEHELKLASMVFEYTLEGILILDKDGNVLRVNKTFGDITDYTEEEILNHSILNLPPFKVNENFMKQIWKEVKIKGEWQGEFWGKRKNGESFPMWFTFISARGSKGQIINYILIITDITNRKIEEKKLKKLAFYDGLTGLPNRLLFYNRLQHTLLRARRNKEYVAVMFLDLDGFKQVNDTYGHDIGDELLKEVGKRLQHTVRKIDTVARLAGDEFTIIIENLNSPDNVNVIARKILNSFKEPFIINGNQIRVGTSIGIAVFPLDGSDADTLIKNADMAMYLAKKSGKNRYVVYTKSE